jgi:hypothetical protein
MVESGRVSPARRYNMVSYLQVEWEAIEAPKDETMGSMGATRGLPNVYMRVLERVERTVGSPIASDILLLIHASRNGLTLEELTAISPCSIEQVETLMTELRNHVVSRDGRFDLLNDYIGRAIETRYGGSEGANLLEARERIADYLETLGSSMRVAEELPWQLLELGALDRLELCVTASPVATLLCDAGRRGDLYLYWNALQDHCDLRSSYARTSRGKNSRHSDEVLKLLSRYYSVRSAVGSDEPEIRITHPVAMEGMFVGVRQVV